MSESYFIANMSSPNKQLIIFYNLLFNFYMIVSNEKKLILFC